MKVLNQRGDTIVEVLLALTVLATVVGSAYAIASRSLVRAQQAQERIHGTKLAEEQIERLKYLAENRPSIFADLKTKDFTLNTPVWCIDNSINLSNSCRTTNNLFTYKFSAYSNNLFTINVSWDSLRSVKDTVTMYYKVQTE
jgi:Tfp pilus assembly protein PilV